jgi:hypothetical protein
MVLSLKTTLAMNGFEVETVFRGKYSDCSQLLSLSPPPRLRGHSSALWAPSGAPAPNDCRAR